MALHPQLDELINAMLPFVQEFHAKAQLAPHAASINTTGEIEGSALVTQDNRNVSVHEALAHFESKFLHAAKAGEIVASAVFFHGVGLAEPGRPAQTEEEARAIVALLEHKAGESVFLVIPYAVSAGAIHYEMGKLIAKPAAVFLVSPSSPKKEIKPWWRIW